MARDIDYEGRDEPVRDGAGMRVAVVCGRFNDHVTMRLLEGVRRGLDAIGVETSGIREVWVPGAFEIPLAAKTLARTGRFDAVICIGCVIRGDTAHFDLVAAQCAEGSQRVGLETEVPVIFGVLTTENLEQALVRSEGPGGHNVGEEAARAALDMATLLASIRHG